MNKQIIMDNIKRVIADWMRINRVIPTKITLTIDNKQIVIILKSINEKGLQFEYKLEVIK